MTTAGGKKTTTAGWANPALPTIRLRQGFRLRSELRRTRPPMLQGFGGQAANSGRRSARPTIRRQRERRVGPPGLQYDGERTPGHTSDAARHRKHVDRIVCCEHNLNDVNECIVHRIAGQRSGRVRKACARTCPPSPRRLAGALDQGSDNPNST
jgi:hypothetical protein